MTKTIGTDCIHEMTVDTCTICRAHGAPVVYVTAGGLHYHRQRSCRSLAAGQDAVRARDGEAAPITTARLGSADTEYRRPCKTCCTQ